MVDFLFRLESPVLAALDPERAHGLTVQALKLGLGGTPREADDPILATSVWGLRFPNPIGLAAGFGATLGVGFGITVGLWSAPISPSASRWPSKATGWQ